MGVDYYGVLQIPKSSTDLEIKRAYRNLALEFNPERLQDEHAKQVFELIAEAYDVLGSPLRRAVFDQYGEEGLKRGVPGPKEYIQPYHFHGDPMRTYKFFKTFSRNSPEDVNVVFFRDFFGTASPYADLLNYLTDPKPLYDLPEGRGVRKKQPPIVHSLKLTLHEVYFGGVKKMKIHRLTYIDQECNRTEVREKILSIPIKPGIRPETEIVFPEEGDQNPTQIPADVIFITQDRPHEIFFREKDNLVMVVEITLQEALLGTTVTVNTIDHRKIRIPITDVIHPNYEKVVENEGMPIVDRPGTKGNLVIRFKIEYPKYLPKASKNLLQKGFNLARVAGGGHEQEFINKIVLADKILRVDPDEQMPP